MRWVFRLVCACALGAMPMVACVVSATSPCGDCDDGNPCTSDRCGKHCLVTPGCYEWVPECKHSPVTDGTPCGSGEVCVEGVCRENLCEGVCGENPCEGVDCDDGDLCTADHCSEWTGCYNEPVRCWDGDRCAMCDPETGECSDTLAERHWCEANHTLGISGTYLHGSCESGRCTGQPCDLTSEEVYPCPVEQDPTALDDWVCCNWWGDPYNPPGYCMPADRCESDRPR